MNDVVVALTTVPDDDSAELLARTLIEEKLAACVNLLPPMTSVYRWQGAVERSTERQMIIKTRRSALAGLQSRLVELHSYELPEFIVIDVEVGSRDYLAWVLRETSDAQQ